MSAYYCKECGHDKYIIIEGEYLDRCKCIKCNHMWIPGDISDWKKHAYEIITKVDLIPAPNASQSI